jgi:hypothetical protein
MRACGQAWQGLAEALQAASESPRPEFSEVNRALEKLIQAETRYHREATRLSP